MKHLRDIHSTPPIDKLSANSDCLADGPGRLPYGDMISSDHLFYISHTTICKLHALRLTESTVLSNIGSLVFHS